MTEVTTPTARTNSGNITPTMAPSGDSAYAAAPRPPGNQAGPPAGTERDREGSPKPRLTGGVGHADVAPDGQPHPREPGDRRERGAEEEGDRAAQPDGDLAVLRRGLGRQSEVEDDDQDQEEQPDRAELAVLGGPPPDLDRSGDRAHPVGSLGSRQDASPEEIRHDEGQHGDGQDHQQRAILERPEDGFDTAGFLGEHGHGSDPPRGNGLEARGL